MLAGAVVAGRAVRRAIRNGAEEEADDADDADEEPPELRRAASA
jgi:hypothetical protein